MMRSPITKLNERDTIKGQTRNTNRLNSVATFPDNATDLVLAQMPFEAIL